MRDRLHMQRLFHFFWCVPHSSEEMKTCRLNTSEAVILKTHFSEWCCCPVLEEGVGQEKGEHWLPRQFSLSAEAKRGDWLSPALSFLQQSMLKIQEDLISRASLAR